MKVTYERSEEDWDNVLQTNLRGVGMVIEAAVKRMIPAGRGGSIVNTASIAGIERGVTMGGGIYAASKAGLIQLSKVMSTCQHVTIWACTFLEDCTWHVAGWLEMSPSPSVGSCRLIL